MSNLLYTGDALFAPCPNGGDLQFENGEPLRSGGLSGAVYISMFGGNDFDAGEPNSKLAWWGNFIEGDEHAMIHGRTGSLAMQLPLVSKNLLRLEEAGQLDLAWMLALGVATDIEIAASIEDHRRLGMTVAITASGSREIFKYRENWAAGEFEPVGLDCAI